MTIDQLAAASEMTVRNIRAHQSRGLLPPPRIDGRTGYYGRHHLNRLKQIRQMQDEGLNLAAIAKVLIDGRLTAVAAGPFREEVGETADAEDLIRRLGLSEEDPVILRAMMDGFIAIDGDKVRVDSPRLLAAAEELVGMGVPLAAQLDAVEVVQEASARVAEAFLQLADEHLVARLAIDTQVDLERLTPAVEQLRSVAATVLEALFNQAMSAAIRDYFDADPDVASDVADSDGVDQAASAT